MGRVHHAWPAGSAGTPLSAKLGVRPGLVVALLDAPDDIEALLSPLPPGVDLRRPARARLKFVWRRELRASPPLR